jgi:hypothetical protein
VDVLYASSIAEVSSYIGSTYLCRPISPIWPVGKSTVIQAEQVYKYAWGCAVFVFQVRLVVRVPTMTVGCSRRW